jgi:hypothetical protein
MPMLACSVIATCALAGDSEPDKRGWSSGDRSHGRDYGRHHSYQRRVFVRMTTLGRV